MARSTDISKLHPHLRVLVPTLERQLADAGLPLERYEGWRSPFRQSELYALGEKTKAKAWSSFHQFGLALDYVFKVNGKWTWEEPAHGMWALYQGIVRKLGLHVLSFERPHCQLGSDIGEALAGNLPVGDDSWRDNLATSAELWGSTPRVLNWIHHPGAPAWTLDLAGRPDVAHPVV